MTAEDMKTAALSGGPSSPFAVAYLQLCQASYLPVATIAQKVAGMPILNPGGSWRCVWGPAESEDQSNLAFVAVYDCAPNMPVFAATVLRGTDLDVNDGWGILLQTWEDLDVLTQVPPPFAPQGPARVAQGTLDALAVITHLTSGGQTLPAFLHSFLSAPANNRPVLVVTGHSLGGCLVSVVAPWLKVTLEHAGVAVPIVPASFAAPTAGNSAFADYFDQSFRYALRVNNSLDVAPFGWGNLERVTSLYDQCDLPIPDLAYILTTSWQRFMHDRGVSYAQPRTNNAPLQGVCYPTGNWYDELAHQHHTTTYMALLGGTSIVPPPTLASSAPGKPPRTSLRPRIEAAEAKRQR